MCASIKLDEVVHKYTKSADVQLEMYNNFGLEHNDKDPRFKYAGPCENIKMKKYFREGLRSKFL